MKGACYLGESRLEVRDYPDPKPGFGEVLIQMKAAGLCGSDLHKYHSSREWAAQRKGMISGHEPAGVVAALGPGVDAVHVGDRVSVYHSLGCGHCRFCLSGTPVFCRNEGAFGRTRDGCHADLMTTPARYCLPLPDDFSFATGAMLACSALTAFASLQKVPLRHGDTLAVFGLGPVGLAGLLMANAMGIRVFGVEVNPYRIEVAGRYHAGTLINPSTTDPVKAIRDATDGEGVSGVLECSGSEKARTQAAEASALHGCVVIVGAGGAMVSIDALMMIRKELVVRGNSVFSIGDYYRAVDFLKKHPIPLDDMVTHRYKIEEASQAFAVFDSGNTGKVVFEWE
jgi:(R,R)-butanediol dehydrogenase / meso-butanediol dehydrogenase / diacetyl reductase